MKNTIKTVLILSATVIALSLYGCAPYGELTTMQFDQLQYPTAVKKIALDEKTTIAYTDEGSGEHTIIFIHGLGSYLPAWKKNTAELKNNYRVIAIDLPGYGKSSKPNHSGMMEYYADVVYQFAQKLGLKKVVLAGHSMGGQISMTAAMKYPDFVSHLILAAPAGFERFTEGQKQWFRDVMTVELVKTTPTQAIRANLMVNFYNMPEDAEFMITDRIAMRGAAGFENYCYAVVRSVNGMVDQPVIDKLNRIKQPTLIVFGENDNLIPNAALNGGSTVDIAMAGKNGIPNSQLVMIPECGHFLQFERPDVFNQSIRNFLK